jgi:glutamate synthase (NADPH/NADH) small chain
VLLAMGFVLPVHAGLLDGLGVGSRGDMRRGQSLIVCAIREGRQTAHAVDSFVMGLRSWPQ